MEKAIVTFQNPKNGQKIVINLAHNPAKEDLDIKVKFDPTPNEDEVIGFIGFLSQMFLTQLVGNEDDAKQLNTPDSNSGESSLRD